MLSSAPLRIDLATLRTQHVVQLGAALRARAAERRAHEIRAVGDVATSLLYEVLRDERGGHALALVRMYLTRPFRDLCPAQQRFAADLAGDLSLEPGVACLTLASSRGVRPEWNDPTRSRGHQAIPLPSVAAVERLPMVARLLQQLGLDVAPVVTGDIEILLRASERRFNAFHVPVAADSPFIPAQAEFVAAHGIASAVGFGGVLPDGAVFAVVAFSTVPISELAARASELLALYLRLALLDANDLQANDPLVALRSRAAALEELVEVQETGVIEWAERMADERDEQRRAYVDALAIRERQVREQNEKLERTQRAMLSVIEDLREARAELEERVAARTRELDAANRDLAERNLELTRKSAELSQLNQELTHSNRELEDFAYIASHDLQEPLRTISGYLQLLQKRYGDRFDGDAEEFIQFAVTGAHRLQALIESLLAYSRVTTRTTARERIPLRDVIGDVTQSLAAAIEESRAEIHANGLPVVWGDRLQLVQLFQNLVSNSLKFRGDGAARVWIDAAPEGEFWRIEVKDAGIGFDPRFADSVFRVFRRLQRKHPGTGIGLSICKKIVERHGGWIRSDAAPGQGARFEFTLPRFPEDA